MVDSSSKVNPQYRPIGQADAEPQGFLSRFTDTAFDAARGVGDTMSAVVHFPDDVTGYVSGRDARMGERRAWSNYAGNFGWSDNPVTRLADTANMLFYGGIDLAMGHIPNKVVNEWMGINFRYFAPPQTSARGIAAESSMLALMVAAPAVKARATRALGIEKPAAATPDVGKEIERINKEAVEARQVFDTATGRQTGLREKVFEAELKARIYFKRPVSRGTIRGLIESASVDDYQSRSRAVQFLWGIYEYDVGLFRESDIPSLLSAYRAGTGELESIIMNVARHQSLSQETLLSLTEISRSKPDTRRIASNVVHLTVPRESLAPEHISLMIETDSYRGLMKAAPELFGPEHVSQLTDTMIFNRFIDSYLVSLFQGNSEFGAEHFQAMLGRLKEHSGWSPPWGNLRIIEEFIRSKPEYFEPVKIGAWVDEGQYVLLEHLARMKPALFAAEDAAKLMTAARKGTQGSARVLWSLAYSRPEFFSGDDLFILLGMAAENPFVEKGTAFYVSAHGGKTISSKRLVAKLDKTILRQNANEIRDISEPRVPGELAQYIFEKMAVIDLEIFTADHVSSFIEMGHHRMLKQLVHGRPEIFEPAHISALIKAAREGRTFAGEVMDRLAHFRPDLFGEAELSSLGDISYGPKIRATVLTARAEQEAAHPSSYDVSRFVFGKINSRAVRRLAEENPSLFDGDHVSELVRNASMRGRELVLLARARPELFKTSHVDMLREWRAWEVLYVLWDKRPDIFTKKQIDSMVWNVLLRKGISK